VGDQIRRNEMGRNVSHIGDRRGAYYVLAGKSEGKNPLGMPRSRWEANRKNSSSRSGMGRRGVDCRG